MPERPHPPGAARGRIAYCPKCGVVELLPAEERVAGWVQQNEGREVSPYDVAADIGVSGRTARRALVALERAGRIRAMLGEIYNGSRKRRYYMMEGRP